jgi:hypothetical protein
MVIDKHRRIRGGVRLLFGLAIAAVAISLPVPPNELDSKVVGEGGALLEQLQIEVIISGASLEIPVVIQSDSSVATEMLPPSEWLVLTISYPTRIRENESATVSVSLDFLNAGHWGRGAGAAFGSPVLPTDVELTLAGAAFQVAPSYLSSNTQGSPLPVKWYWSISPIKPGKHRMVLDLSEFRNEMIPAASIRPFEGFSSLLVHLSGAVDGDFTLSELHLIDLEVNVMTTEGLPIWAGLLIRYILALAAFVLMYPAVSGWISRIPTRRSRT